MAADPVFIKETKAKDIHLVVSKLLAPKDVLLGRFVSDIWDPLEGAHKIIADSTTSRNVQGVQSIGNTEHAQRLSEILTKLLSATSSTTSRNQSQVTATNLEHIKLQNPERFFNIAITQNRVRKWLDETWLYGLPAFMITGYSIVRDLNISETSNKDQTLSTTTPINLSPHNMGVNLAGLSLGGHQVEDTTARAFCPGENIWAVLYRKVKLRTTWLTSSLSQSSQAGSGWVITLGIRGREHKVLIEPELETRGDAAGKCGVMERLKLDAEEWDPFIGEPELIGEPEEEDMYVLATLKDEIESDNEPEQEGE